MLGWATSAVGRVKVTEAEATGKAEDGPELVIVLRERAALILQRADEAYPRTRETRERYTDAGGYDAGYRVDHEADGPREDVARPDHDGMSKHG